VSKQLSSNVEPGTLSADVAASNGAFPELVNESEELVEKEVRDRFKKMCEGYFDNVSKKLVIEHKVHTFTSLIHARIHAMVRNYKIKIAGTTKHTSVLEKFLRTANKPTRK
jgi:hypothetical protein